MIMRKKENKARVYSLDLLGIFVANENDDWVDVNAVEAFDGVWGNVEQTVTVLRGRTHHGCQNTETWQGHAK